MIHPPTHLARSNTLSLDAVLHRLQRHDVVDGVILIGSTGKEMLTEASDYDLYIVLSSMPAPLHVGLTWIAGRVTDLVFEQTTAVDRYLAQHDAAPRNAGQERLVRYATAGRIVLDRHTRLDRVRRRAQESRRTLQPSESDTYRLWFGINYNLLHTKRLLASNDPVYQSAVDIRLLYMTAEVVVGYFQLRGLPWRGEKEAIRYFTEHDPAFLHAFNASIAAPNRAGKMQAYEGLASLALAPLGGLWSGAVTALQFEETTGLSTETVDEVLSFWDGLLAD
jgi:hypothetical protein